MFFFLVRRAKLQQNHADWVIIYFSRISKDAASLTEPVLEIYWNISDPRKAKGPNRDACSHILIQPAYISHAMGYVEGLRLS